MENFSNSKYVKEVCDITSNMYNQGWDERNGGNISYLLTKREVSKFSGVDRVIREIPLNFEADLSLKGKYFLVTGTGKYFKNVIKNPEESLGLIRIKEDLKNAELLWGYSDGGKFTSELPAHLMSHAARLKVDSENRIIMHTHPTYTICMNACCELDENNITKKLWQSNTEAVVVFPDGVGVLPAMICGTNEIGIATAQKMKDYRIVLWTNHGIYGAGRTIDEAFGLIETVEKTAQIYMISLGHVVNVIPDEIILGIAKLWNITPKKGVLSKQ